MPSFVNHWFGIQDVTSPAAQEHTLQITDGELVVDFSVYDCNYGVGTCVPVPDDIAAGWALVGPTPWQMQTAGLKNGGYYANSMLAHGQMLRHGVFDNVTESFQAHLKFYGPDGMIQEVDILEELLLRRATRYWTKRREYSPVYVIRALPGESNLAYALISQGSVLKPQNMWSSQCTLETGFLKPVLVSFIRQPFWLGAAPGEAQSTVEISALQNWEFQLSWTEETALPSGYVYSFVQTAGGDLFASGQSEVLRWTNSAWSAVNTAPVTLAENLTSSVLLGNGDILFGGNGRIIRRSSDGTWAVESNLPNGQVFAMLLANSGVVYAGDNGNILARDTDGTWSVDSTLPIGSVYSFLQASDGNVFAGEVGRILKTTTGTAESAPIDLTRYSWAGGEPAGSLNDAEEYSADGSVAGYSAPNHIFAPWVSWVGIRFLDVTIPSGATINSAVLRFRSLESLSTTGASMRIYCERSADPDTFYERQYEISSRSRTTNYTTWRMEDEWSRTSDWRYESPDFSDALQEVINLSGWASGNSVAVLLEYVSSTSHREIYNHCYLDVTYTVPIPGGATWEVNTTLPGGNVRSLLESSISDLILAGEDGQILGSDDLGVSWGVISTLPTSDVRALAEIGGYTYAGDNGNILRSIDGGRTWASQSALPTGYVHDFIYEAATDDTRAGDDGRILWLDETLQTSLGRDVTTEDDIFVVNHHKECNLTHILRASGGGAVFSANLFPMDTFPTELFPAPVANNDAIYFGVDTSVDDSGPFCNLIFDIAQHARGTFTTNWEYWNGGWVALTVHDETSGFTEPSVHGVFWKQPSDWTTTAVDGTTGYWVRARLSDIVPGFSGPTQQNRTIYSCITPFVNVDDLQLGGNVDPIVQLRLHNRSDEGGPGGSQPQLYMNRVWIGAKETDGHEDFRAYLNFADEQNPEGVTVDVTVDPDSATSIEADTNLSSATGRRVFVDAGIIAAGLGTDNWEDRVAIELDTTIARDFYGTYMPLLICKQDGGSAGEVHVRLKVVSGTGGISMIGDTQITQSTTDHELIVFDSPITIPVSSQMTDSDIGDETSVIVQVSVEANDADLYLYGLFLQPTDDAWIECEDNANTAESSLEDGRQLLIDSISIPKSPTRSVVQRKATNAFVSTWHFDGNGSCRLICKKDQRLWFHFARTNGAASTLWLSEPEMACSVRLSMTSRYLFGRGSD